MKKQGKILIFGAAGFIATYLIDELIKQGCQVIASDINPIGYKFYNERNIPYFEIDITQKDDFNKIKAIEADAVVNLAALQPANFDKAKYTPADYININVIGTLNILEFCRTANVKKIIYGCSHRNTSGLWDTHTTLKEEDGVKIEHKGEYAMFSISETTAQDCVDYYRCNFGLQGIIFRLPPVYGFGSHLEIFKNGKPIKTGFQTFIENAISGKPIEIWGNTSIGRDIIYVKDVVDAFIKALEKDDINGLYNITSNYYLTLQEEIETIIRVFSKDAKNHKIILCPEKAHTIDSFLYDNSKAKRDLDWEPVYSFEDMLRDYKKEMENKNFEYLIEKRKLMFGND
jgi:UDP-glucose 4-epimerase